MNTPYPCNQCDHLYYDCMLINDPNYEAECKLELLMGDYPCPKFKFWEAKKAPAPSMTPEEKLIIKYAKAVLLMDRLKKFVSQHDNLTCAIDVGAKEEEAILKQKTIDALCEAEDLAEKFAKDI